MKTPLPSRLIGERRNIVHAWSTSLHIRQFKLDFLLDIHCESVMSSALGNAHTDQTLFQQQGTTFTPSSHRSSSCPTSPTTLQVERPGTAAAGAVSILALIGILVVSTGSVIRSNRGDGSASSGSGSGDSSSGGSRGLSGTVSSLCIIYWSSFGGLDLLCARVFW